PRGSSAYSPSPKGQREGEKTRQRSAAPLSISRPARTTIRCKQRSPGQLGDRNRGAASVQGERRYDDAIHDVGQIPQELRGRQSGGREDADRNRQVQRGAGQGRRVPGG